jgi:ribose 5-phosphate isomerase A
VLADVEKEKLAAARAAVALVEREMFVALGTGTTANHAIRALAEKFPDGGGLTTVASSEASERLARSLGLRVRALSEGDVFDLMIDGADEVAPDLSLTKGGGGALFREKVLARESRALLIAVDHTKLVRALGERKAIPVEVVRYARPVLMFRFRALGLNPELRRHPDGSPYITETGHEILDLHLTHSIDNPETFDRQVQSFSGVVETGLFIGLAHRVFVGESDGSVRELAPLGPGSA